MSETDPLYATATQEPSVAPPLWAPLFYRNKPGAFYVFRDQSHRVVAPCGAQIRCTKDGVPIPRVRMSKKMRIRARRKEQEMRQKFEQLMASAHGREAEVRQLYVDKLNEFVAAVGRQPDEQEKQSLVYVAIEALPVKTTKEEEL